MYFQTLGCGTGEIAQRLRALAALSEDQRSNPNTCVRLLPTIWTQLQEIQYHFLAYRHLNTQYTHTKIQKQKTREGTDTIVSSNSSTRRQRQNNHNFHNRLSIHWVPYLLGLPREILSHTIIICLVHFNHTYSSNTLKSLRYNMKLPSPLIRCFYVFYLHPSPPAYSEMWPSDYSTNSFSNFKLHVYACILIIT